MVFIYTLERNNIPFYIGKCKNRIRRKHKHYTTFGNDISLIVIDEVKDDKNEWKFWESHYISLYKSWGFELLNKNEGGGGPSNYTEEQKLKMRKPRKKGTGKKISKTLLKNNHSKYYTKEVRNKMSISQKDIAKPFTKEHIVNISKANLESKGKKLKCFNLDGILVKRFNCLREGKEWLIKKNKLISINVDKQIKDCCNGRQKTCHGYKWEYEK